MIKIILALSILCNLYSFIIYALWSYKSCHFGQEWSRNFGYQYLCKNLDCVLENHTCEFVSESLVEMLKHTESLPNTLLHVCSSYLSRILQFYLCCTFK